MTVSKSVEIRWFFDQPWSPFDQWGEREPVRTDYYAPIADERSSVKLRGGESRQLIETKHLVGQRGVFQLWAKHSMDFEEDPAHPFAELAKSNWWAVSKSRRLKHLSGDFDQRFMEIDCQSDDPSLQVEWSRIKLQGQTSFTFCIEAAVDDESHWDDTLVSVESLLKHLTEKLALGRITQCKPASYPSWLVRHLPRSKTA